MRVWATGVFVAGGYIHVADHSSVMIFQRPLSAVDEPFSWGTGTLRARVAPNPFGGATDIRGILSATAPLRVDVVDVLVHRNAREWSRPTKDSMGAK